jgi:hypothetical protein
VAHVARYHRGATPNKRKHVAFGALDRAMRRRVRRLAALLRVADGLDRGHVSGVDCVRVTWEKGRCRIAPAPVPAATSLRLELWGGSRKSDLLAELLDAPVELVAPDGATVVAAGRTRGSKGEERGSLGRSLRASLASWNALRRCSRFAGTRARRCEPGPVAGLSVSSLERTAGHRARFDGGCRCRRGGRGGRVTFRLVGRVWCLTGCRGRC